MHLDFGLSDIDFGLSDFDFGLPDCFAMAPLGFSATWRSDAELEMVRADALEMVADALEMVAVDADADADAWFGDTGVL